MLYHKLCPKTKHKRKNLPDRKTESNIYKNINNTKADGQVIRGQGTVGRHICVQMNGWLRSVFLKLWSADHKWSSGSALVVLLD